MDYHLNMSIYMGIGGYLSWSVDLRDQIFLRTQYNSVSSKENIYKIFINNSLVTENQYEIVSNSDSTYYKENWIIVFNGRPDLITINNSDSIINYYKAAFYILNDTLILNKNNILYHYFIKEE
jgi:hypothetical protein